MAMQPISPVAVAVTAHWRTGAPTAVTFEGISRKVTQVLALRREYGVFSASEGPRTLWEIETEDAALVLSFSRRTGAWTIPSRTRRWTTSTSSRPPGRRRDPSAGAEPTGRPARRCGQPARDRDVLARMAARPGTARADAGSGVAARPSGRGARACSARP